MLGMTLLQITIYWLTSPRNAMLFLWLHCAIHPFPYSDTLHYSFHWIVPLLFPFSSKSFDIHLLLWHRLLPWPIGHGCMNMCLRQLSEPSNRKTSGCHVPLLSQAGWTRWILSWGSSSRTVVGAECSSLFSPKPQAAVHGHAEYQPSPSKRNEWQEEEDVRKAGHTKTEGW